MTIFLGKKIVPFIILKSLMGETDKNKFLNEKKIPFNLERQDKNTQNSHNCISGVMVSVLVSSVVGHGFEPWLGHTKDYELDICCFSVMHAAFRKQSKDWLARNRDNVSEWGDMSIRRLLFQLTSTTKIQLSLLV